MINCNFLQEDSSFRPSIRIKKNTHPHGQVSFDLIMKSRYSAEYLRSFNFQKLAAIPRSSACLAKAVVQSIRNHL